MTDAARSGASAAAGPVTFGGATAERPWREAFWRGAAGHCPQCGRGKLFAGYVKTADRCAQCGLDFTGHRADDAPPYVTCLVVGHVTIPLALAGMEAFDLPLAAHFAFWIPVILALTLALLPRAKGALVGLQWANRMHGFGNGVEDLPIRP